MFETGKKDDDENKKFITLILTFLASEGWPYTNLNIKIFITAFDINL
jgi:hypothetical protein